jgi:hypothetical protein
MPFGRTCRQAARHRRRHGDRAAYPCGRDGMSLHLFALLIEDAVAIGAALLIVMAAS